MKLDLVEVHWIGTRKDSGKGAIWGWFTEKGKRSEPPYDYGYRLEEIPPVYCHTFRGSVGKKLHVEECLLTNDFLRMVEQKKKNFRELDRSKISLKWCKNFEEEISMYIMMLRMKG